MRGHGSDLTPSGPFEKSLIARYSRLVEEEDARAKEESERMAGGKQARRERARRNAARSRREAENGGSWRCLRSILKAWRSARPMRRTLCAGPARRAARMVQWTCETD